MTELLRVMLGLEFSVVSDAERYPGGNEITSGSIALSLGLDPRLVSLDDRLRRVRQEFLRRISFPLRADGRCASPPVFGRLPRE